jgi:purine-binding chemotaxis protein CheW
MDLAKIRKKVNKQKKEAEEDRKKSYDEGHAEKSSSTSAKPEGIEAPPEQPEYVEERRIRLLCFNLGKEIFALKMDDVNEIIRTYRVTPIPKTPPYLLGVLTLRGKIIPVLDMKQKLNVSNAEIGNPEQERHYSNKIIIGNGPKGPIGFFTERVIGVIDVYEEELKKGPTHIREEQARYIEAVVIQKGRFITILRANEALSLEIQRTETGGIKENGNS